MKRKNSLRPFSICLSAASRFSFILIFLPEMAERGAPSSLLESLLQPRAEEEERFFFLLLLRLLSFFLLLFLCSFFLCLFLLSFLSLRFLLSFLAFFSFCKCRSGVWQVVSKCPLAFPTPPRTPTLCLLFSSFSVLSLFLGLPRSSSEMEEDEALLLPLSESDEEEEDKEEDEEESASSRFRFFIFLRCFPSSASLSSLLSRPLLPLLALL